MVYRGNTSAHSLIPARFRGFGSRWMFPYCIPHADFFPFFFISFFFFSPLQSNPCCCETQPRMIRAKGGAEKNCTRANKRARGSVESCMQHMQPCFCNLVWVSFSGPDVLSRYDGSVWADCDEVEAMKLPYDIQPVHSSDKRSCSFSSLWFGCGWLSCSVLAWVRGRPCSMMCIFVFYESIHVG